MRSHFDVFQEGLRFPWTKFSIILMFCYAFYFSTAVFEIGKKIKRRNYLVVFLGLIFVFLVVWMFPVFNGNLISNSRKISLPKEYSDLFSWLDQQQPEQRISYFPIATFRGWEYYRWGFEGAGFLWFGLKQPILVRDFDRWNPYNENYYWEISYALYSKNKELFEKVLEKYQINWLLVDENVINPTSPRALYLDELEEILMASDKISLAEEFGKIKIYQVDLETPVKDFVFLAKNLPTVGPKYNWNNHDVAYSENGNYISSPTSHSYYPFRSLFTGRSQDDREFSVEDMGDYLLFKNTVPDSYKDFQLIIPEETKELIWVDPENLSRVRYLNPEVRFDGGMIEVIVPRVSGYYSAEIEPAAVPDIQISKNCNQFSQGEVGNEIVEEEKEKFLRLTATDANNCSPSFWLPNLPHKLSYLITVGSRHIKGKSLLFWLENLNARRVDIETYLPKSTSAVSYFIQPPMEKDGMGYTLHLDDISIGKEKSVNDLGKITVNLIPYNFLIGIKLTGQPTESNHKLNPPLSVSHPNPSFYRVERDPTPNQVLVLSQAFHPGWQAYEAKEGIPALLTPIFGKKISQHFLINNWANGWMLENQKKIDIIFLPQLLEYFGFFLLFIFSCSTLYFLLK